MKKVIDLGNNKVDKAVGANGTRFNLRARDVVFCKNGEEVYTLKDNNGLSVKTRYKKKGLLVYYGNDKDGKRTIICEYKEPARGRFKKDIYDDYIIIPDNPTDEEKEILDIILKK